MRTKSGAPWLLLFLLPLMVTACFDKSESASTVYVSVVGPNAGPSPTPSNAGPSACPTVTRVNLGPFAGSEPLDIKVGEITRLDATPFAGETKLSDSCSQQYGVTWPTGDGTVCARVGESGSFSPEVKGLSVGTCAYSAKVGNVTSPFVTITVR